MRNDEERGEFGAWLHHERHRRGWSVRETASRLTHAGFPVVAESVWRWERGQSPRALHRGALIALFADDAGTHPTDGRAQSSAPPRKAIVTHEADRQPRARAAVGPTAHLELPDEALLGLSLHALVRRIEVLLDAIEERYVPGLSDTQD